MEQSGRDPGTIQADQDQADLLALGGQVVNNFLCNVADGAHSDDDAVSVLGAVVVEQVVVGAQLFVDLGHVLLNNGRQSLVSGVAGLTMLEGKFHQLEDSIILPYNNTALLSQLVPFPTLYNCRSHLLFYSIVHYNLLFEA